MDLDTQRGNVFLLEFTSQMTLDECSLLQACQNVLMIGIETVITFPVPPSPTRTSLKVGMPLAALFASMFAELNMKLCSME